MKPIFQSLTLAVVLVLGIGFDVIRETIRDAWGKWRHNEYRALRRRARANAKHFHRIHG